ncbi:isoprenyl transferase [Vallitalea sp.]|jgi:undecaprenyl diphosphate synthase|uniref:isoprenyl transferase n=1 Tax=Vallitalea sp. TaxID=1882829 RepID=UPI0025E70C47|nr:isoprenyl transferase [Vallitalea sp.]MCT4688262.1 isoprenyl transferase [Vallitalea sp.]
MVVDNNYNVPRHVAIIMDGNGRWAMAKGKKRQYGHRQGSKTLETICKQAYDIGIEYITVYAFSTENWSRPKEEIDNLMNLLRQYLKSSLKNASRDNIKVRVIGNKIGLDNDIITSIERLEEGSKDNTGLQLQIALNYGGRDEIVRMTKKIVSEFENNNININTINQKTIERYLDTKDIPDPDLLIRTSGEMRISNFLLWQLAYTEFYFVQKHWPDFTIEDLKDAIEYYSNIERRYGKVKE